MFSSVDQSVISIMVIFMIIAAIDRCIGSKFGLGDQIDEALGTIGPMCLPMVGMILMAPLIGRALGPIVSPFFTMLGADPAMFATTILACDMGGHPLAAAMATTPEGAQFAGCILGCSLGGVFSFLMPVGITMVKREFHDAYALGVLLGVVTIPLGMFAGGLAAGYQISMIASNTLPILIISIVIALALWRARSAAIAIFKVFGRVLSAVATIGFTIGVLQELTPVRIIDDLEPVLEGVKVVGSVAIVLCGAYPMLAIIRRIFARPIVRAGRVMSIDDTAVLGILGGIANIMPILGNCNKMSADGVTVAMAFAVSGTCILGDHLGYIASVDRSMIMPMLAAKAVGAIASTMIAVMIVKRQQAKRA